MPGEAVALWLYHGAVDGAAGWIGAPVRDGSQRISRRQLLINVNAETGFVTAVEVAFSDLSNAGKHFVHDWRKVVLFLNTESTAGDVDVIAGNLINGVVLATFLKSSPDAEDLAERGELLDWGDAAGRCHPAADEVDQTVLDERHHFKRM